MTSQSFCSLSVSLRAVWLVGTSGNKLTGFRGLKVLWVGVLLAELLLLSGFPGGGSMLDNQPEDEFWAGAWCSCVWF